MRLKINRFFVLIALIALPIHGISQTQTSSTSSLILKANDDYKKGEYTECVNMLKGIVPLLHDPIEIVAGYNTYLLSSLRCDTHQAEKGLEQFANSVRNELLPNIYQTKTEYERQLLWQMTALSLHQYAMSIALCSESADTKRLAYKLVQVAKNLEIEADQYARTVMAKDSQANADLISRYDTMKDSLYFTDVEAVLDSMAMGIEMSKMAINEQIPIHEVFDNVSNYEQVRNSLPPNCTMVEYCIYRALAGEDRYGAFIFDSNSDMPIAVDVCSADDVDQLITKEKSNIIELYNSNSLYLCLLANIRPYIKHPHLILCPVGRLEHFNFSAFGIDDKRMMDTYKLSRATNGHRYAVARLRSAPNLESAILYGGIAYSDEQAKQAKAASKHFKFTDEERSPRGTLSYLQYSNYEIDAIREIMRKNKIQCKLLSGKAATTETFKGISSRSPSVLHIATHGFCIKDDKKPFYSLYEEGKLLYSGLYFASSQNQNRNTSNIKGGVLTSYEISHIDLTNTQLVVLSACDTADGITNNIEGLYGLQYAFRRAGAGAMLLNLWRVNDAISYLFMREFYRSLFDCHDIDKAYTDAIQVVKVQYSDPYSWAGFVLIHN